MSPIDGPIRHPAPPDRKPRRHRPNLRLAKSVLRIFGYVLNFFERHPLHVFFALLLLGFVIDLLDSFGLDDVAANVLSNTIDAVSGPMYGSLERKGWQVPKLVRNGQQRIAIVLIDDRALAQYGEIGLPLSYATQREILEKVDSAGPKAIFWDLYYPKPRAAAAAFSNFAGKFGFVEKPKDGATSAAYSDPQIVALARTMRKIGDVRPLLIGPVGDDPLLAPLQEISPADPPSSPSTSPPAKSPLSWATGVHQVFIKISDDGTRTYPMVGKTENFEPNLQFDAARDKSEKERIDELPTLPSAAFGLYRAFCGDKCSDPSRRVDADQDKMIIRWGFGVSREREELLPPALQARCGHSGRGISGVVSYIWHGFARGYYDRDFDTDQAFGLHCGYADTILLSELNNQIKSKNAQGNKVFPKASDLLKDRIVLIGVDIGSSGDRRKVPFYGGVAGVAVHAMAIDNLIESHGRPILAPRKVFWGIDELGLLQYFAIMTVLCVSYASRSPMTHFFSARETRNEQSETLSALIFIFLAIIWLIIFVIAIRRDWPLAVVIFGGLLPGGLAGFLLLIFSKAVARKKVSDDEKI